ncbi:MAG: methyltransferase domain-containing protein [Puniceicoccales bacterium]|jgi:malonyl-ACP O-methyltransferase BioC|nr:methyltransferase domain-containing protein [Puniceicoccales bacterium]
MNHLIGSKFDLAAEHYDAQAIVQKETAIQLVGMVRDLQGTRSVLDVGCGTGFAAIETLKYFPNAKLQVLDISKKMLAIARRKLQGHKVIYTECDAESQEFGTNFDLAISNLCVQWFNNLEKFIQKILKVSKYFAFSTLVDGSFREFSKIFETSGKTSPLLNYKTQQELEGICQSFGEIIASQTKTFKLSFPSAQAAAMHFKKIGANIASNNSNNALALLNHRSPINLEYKVYFCLIRATATN